MRLTPELLLDGPRGRRFLLELALRGARARGGGANADLPLEPAVMLAAGRLASSSGASLLLFGRGARDAMRSRVTPDDVASALLRAALPHPGPRGLLFALRAAVDHARYWQEPDGMDLLAATQPVRSALTRLAELVVAAPAASWWVEPMAAVEQHAVEWRGDPVTLPPDPPMRPARCLSTWRRETELTERRSRRNHPTDPTEPWSGEWWSMPPVGLLRTTRSLASHGPLGLWLVEDGMGWDEAITRTVTITGEPRVYEVDDAEAWARLCRAHYLEVTHHKRHDWYRTTGRDGRWVIPDWQRLAKEFDAVHLTTCAYLTSAGKAIPVDDETATVIAGCNPDETYWLTERAVPRGSETEWYLDDKAVWRRAP